MSSADCPLRLWNPDTHAHTQTNRQTTVTRGASGSKAGWILSRPTTHQSLVNLTLSSAHILKVDTCVVEPTLDDHSKRFWELESIGIREDEGPQCMTIFYGKSHLMGKGTKTLEEVPCTLRYRITMISVRRDSMLF